MATAKAVLVQVQRLFCVAWLLLVLCVLFVALAEYSARVQLVQDYDRTLASLDERHSKLLPAPSNEENKNYKVSTELRKLEREITLHRKLKRRLNAHGSVLGEDFRVKCADVHCLEQGRS